MSRCIASKRLNPNEKLGVYYKQVDGGDDIDNAVVLCNFCYKCKQCPPDFPIEKQQEVLKRSGDQCECEDDKCHGVETVPERLKKGKDMYQKRGR